MRGKITWVVKYAEIENMMVKCTKKKSWVVNFLKWLYLSGKMHN